jgi:hypothetical protein
MPRDNVYYGDVVSLDGLLGWSDTLAWWGGYKDPSQDLPDAYINITPQNYRGLLITPTTQPGMWYQWYGHNEKGLVPVFFVIPKTRPVVVPKNVTQQETPAPVKVRLQPPAIADVLMAKGDAFTYATGEGLVWIIGPTVAVLGEKAKNGMFTMPILDVPPGFYNMVIQAPDANGVYEVFPAEGQRVDSLWKGVEGFWYAPLAPQMIKARLMEMFRDSAHFHGKIIEKTILVEEQSIAVTSVETASYGAAVVRGTTNLAEGDVMKVAWDADRYVLAEDLKKYTTTTTAQGDDAGAYRVFMAVVAVNLNTQPVGDHHITLTTPDGHQTTVGFYVGESFAPFPTPQVTVHYLDNSPFLPTPTPLIIEKVVPVTVIQTIIVPVTPPYNTVLQAEKQAAEEQQAIMVRNILFWGGAGCLLICLAMSGRYLVTVVKRARLQ